MRTLSRWRWAGCATVLYNQLLTALRKDSERSAQISDAFDQWHGRFTAQRALLAGWNLSDFWQCVAEGGGRNESRKPEISSSAGSGWLSRRVLRRCCGADRPARICSNKREWALKKGLARFKNPRALELWAAPPGLARWISDGRVRWLLAVTLPRAWDGSDDQRPSLEPNFSTVLRPPDGMTLDEGIGTTYSLDLTALLVAPLAFTLFDAEDDDGRIRLQSLEVLEGLRRYAGKRAATVFARPGKSTRRGGSSRSSRISSGR